MNQKQKQLFNKLSAVAMGIAIRNYTRKTVEQAERSGAGWGRALFRVSKKHRNRALSNLAMVFPEMPEDERRKLAIRVFEHFGRMTGDFLAGMNRTKEELNASMTVVGLEHLETALAKGKGVLLVTGHFGNWERVGAWMSFNGYKLNVVTRAANDPTIEELVTKLRSGPGTGIIPRGNAARPILECLKRNEAVGILADQNTDDHFLTFFGKAAGTQLGPAVLSERAGAPVIPGYCVWLSPGKYRMVFEEPLEPTPGFDIKGQGMMQSVLFYLERVIREHPEQWLWFHDRWRSARQRGLL